MRIASEFTYPSWARYPMGAVINSNLLHPLKREVSGSMKYIAALVVRDPFLRTISKWLLAAAAMAACGGGRSSSASDMSTAPPRGTLLQYRASYIGRPFPPRLLSIPVLQVEIAAIHSASVCDTSSRALSGVEMCRGGCRKGISVRPPLSSG